MKRRLFLEVSTLQLVNPSLPYKQVKCSRLISLCGHVRRVYLHVVNCQEGVSAACIDQVTNDLCVSIEGSDVQR